MKITKIEELLLQEMIEVKGGTAGICECRSGAHQSTGTGKCICSDGGAVQKLINDPTLPVCQCMGGALQK